MTIPDASALTPYILSCILGSLISISHGIGRIIKALKRSDSPQEERRG